MKLVGAGLVVLVLAGATPASAAPPTDAAATAEVLFREAREMMARGDNAAACPKLAESQRIDPSVGTLLNLGDCYERIGRTASAWATFNDAAAMAIRAEQPERARFAKGRAEALGPKLARLTVEVRASAQGLTVERDGVALGAATWAAALPVDPGPHTLVAKAPHRKTWSTTVSCKEGAAAVVVVPELESVTESAAAGPLRPATATATPKPPPVRDTYARPLAITLTAAGGVAVATGLSLGLVAMSKDNDANRHECSPADCTERGATLLRDASTFATASTVVTLAGAGLVAAGVAVWVFAPTEGVRATVSPSRVSVEGRF